MSGSIEEELWMIFTHYTMQSNPLEPGSLTSHQFVRFARDSQLVTTARSAAEAEIIVSAQLSKGSRRRQRGVALDFSDFIEALAALAPKVHHGKASGALQKVLLENVLPLAHRRTFHRAPVGNRAVRSVLVEHLGRGLDGIFDHLLLGRTKRRKKKVIGYRGFVVLCDAFKVLVGPGAEALLTTTQVCEAYLSATRRHSAYERKRGDDDSVSSQRSMMTRMLSGEDVTAVGDMTMTRRDFDEALLRLAMAAYTVDLPPATKLKAFLLYCWRTVSAPARPQPTSTIHLSDQSREVKKAATTRAPIAPVGSANFSAAFLRMWQRDGFCDYLNTTPIKNNKTITARETTTLEALDGVVDCVLEQLLGTTTTQPLLLLQDDSEEEDCKFIDVSDVATLLASRPDIADLIFHKVIMAPARRNPRQERAPSFTQWRDDELLKAAAEFD